MGRLPPAPEGWTLPGTAGGDGLAPGTAVWGLPGKEEAGLLGLPFDRTFCPGDDPDAGGGPAFVPGDAGVLFGDSGEPTG